MPVPASSLARPVVLQPSGATRRWSGEQSSSGPPPPRRRCCCRRSGRGRAVCAPRRDALRRPGRPRCRAGRADHFKARPGQARPRPGRQERTAHRGRSIGAGDCPAPPRPHRLTGPAGVFTELHRRRALSAAAGSPHTGCAQSPGPLSGRGHTLHRLGPTLHRKHRRRRLARAPVSVDCLTRSAFGVSYLPGAVSQREESWEVTGSICRRSNRPCMTRSAMLSMTRAPRGVQRRQQTSHV